VEGLAKLFQDHIWKLHGLPESIISDRRVQFVAGMMKELHVATKISLFKVNYGQDPRMGFEGRRKGKYEAAGKFIEKMKKIQEEAKAALGKAQEEMKKFGDRRRGKGEEYKVGDLVLLSTKDLK